MADRMLFYKKIVPLNRELHRDLCISTEPGRFAFAATSHLIPAVTDEFALGSRALPIVFLPGAGNPQPAFLVGLRSGENLCIDRESRWTADYMPAYVRRYPFVMGEVADSEPLVCIDDSSALLAEHGAALFLGEGAESPALLEATRLVADYKAAAERTDAFVKTLLENGLFQSINIDVKMGETETRTLHGLLTIDEERLNALPAESFLALREKNYLVPIYAHLFSLIAVDRLRRAYEI